MRYCKTKNLKREAAENYGKHNEANRTQRALSVSPLGQVYILGGPPAGPWGGLWGPWGVFWGLRGSFLRPLTWKFEKNAFLKGKVENLWKFMI